MAAPKEIELRVGRRAQDGTVRLSAYLPNLLTLSVTYRAERAASIMLTREQVRELRGALRELESLIEPEDTSTGQWDGSERRTGKG